MKNALVDVIIPVFKQFELVRQCIDSLLAADCRTQHTIVVIDDCSGEPELSAHLADLAELGAIELHTNRQNLGFTRTVNFGMRLHPDRDVVLLNSDTIAYPQWLDRICAAALSAKDIATVNPMTTQFGSHISCYPGLTGKFEEALEVEDRRLDAIARDVNAGRRIAVHTTVGFCMYISRKALNDIGYFDVENFPVAYGEETDFCYRASKAGWRHLVAGDVFITHLEGRSYGDRKAAMMADMLDRIVRLHPEVPHHDRQFQDTDPVRPIRTAIDLGRIRRLLDGASRLTVATDRGSAATRRSPWLLFDFERAEVSLQTPAYPAESFPNVGVFRFPDDIARFNAALKALCIEELDFATPEVRAAFKAATTPIHPDELGLAVSLGRKATH